MRGHGLFSRPGKEHTESAARPAVKAQQEDE
jgi:hypothetical protein